MKVKTGKKSTRRAKGGTLTTIIREEMGAKPTAIPNVVIAAPPPPPVKVRINHVVYALDDSGSMASCYAEAVRQLNTNFENLRQQARATGQRTDVSLYFFGGGGRVTWVHDRIPVETLRDLDPHKFAHGSSTPLFDAVGEAITDARRAAPRPDADESFLLVVVTDGGENSSRSYGSTYNPEPFRRVMRDAQATDRWTLAFLVPAGGKRGLVGFGVPEGNVIEWENTAEGAREAFTNVTRSTTAYYADRERGATSTKSFFTTDLSAVTKADLNKMDNVSGDFKSWKVDREVDISDFVRSHGATFVLGAGYYQLSKKELLRTGRRLLIREKGTSRIYGGLQARQILGLPGGPVEVTPGNHANFDLFFQSTSNNRKLVRGTELLWDKTKTTDDPETWDSAAAKLAADAKKASSSYV